VQNGQDIPASCVLYAANSPWNRPITNPDNPKLFPNSDLIVQTVASRINGSPAGISSMWASGASVTGITNGDGATVPYFASNSDPLVTYSCSLYCGGSLLNSGVQFRVPAAAHPDLNGDRLFSVIEANGDEYDCWLTRDGVPWSNGATLTAGGCTLFPNIATNSGWVPGAIADDTIRTNSLSNGSASTSGAALDATGIRGSELAAGHIYHALGAAAWCASGSVYPATHFDNPCPFANGIPDGARLWSDLTDSQVNSNSQLSSAEKTILIAMHHYGVYLRDSNGNVAQQTGSFSMYIEGAVTFYSYGQQNPAFTYGQNNGWTYVSSVDRSIFGDSWNPNVSGGIWSHMHIVDTCYAAAAC
jgi:hypothetical protein